MLLATEAAPEVGDIFIPLSSDTFIGRACETCVHYNESFLRAGEVKLVTRDPNVFSHVRLIVIDADEYRPLLRFNVSQVPPGAEIIDAWLRLYILNPPKVGLKLYLHRMLQDYNEEIVGWKRRIKTENWRKPGGYFDPKPIAESELKRRSDEGAMVSFRVTDYVKKVFNGEIEDRGLIVLADPPSNVAIPMVEGYRAEWYVDFYSVEGAERNRTTRYTPVLHVKIVKPEASLSLSDDSVSLLPGESAQVIIQRTGNFEGRAELGYRVVEAPGPKVAYLRVSIPKSDSDQGREIPIEITAAGNAVPGRYVVEFFPKTTDYAENSVILHTVTLTVNIGRTRVTTQSTPFASETQTSDDTATPTSSSTRELGTTTRTKEIPTEEPIRTPSTTTSEVTTVITTTVEAGWGMNPFIFGAVAALIATLTVVLIMRRR